LYDRFGSAVAITLPSVAMYWKPSVLRMKKLSFEVALFAQK